MTDEILPSELGAFTNNLSNKEGIKKLCEKVNDGGVEYTAGDNIQISSENVISATDTKYTAGTNVSISEQNVISATDTIYTAGTGISISAENVISASGGGSWTLRTPNNDWSDLFDIDDNNIVSKKEIFITDNDLSPLWYIPKGITASSLAINIPSVSVDNNTFTTYVRYGVFKARITTSYIDKSTVSVEITTDGTNITCTRTSQSGQISKGNLIIYTKD